MGAVEAVHPDDEFLLVLDLFLLFITAPGDGFLHISAIDGGYYPAHFFNFFNFLQCGVFHFIRQRLHEIGPGPRVENLAHLCLIDENSRSVMGKLLGFEAVTQAQGLVIGRKGSRYAAGHPCGHPADDRTGKIVQRTL